MSRSVVYAVSHLPEWVDAAILNQEKLGWEPVYWITNSVTEELVKNAFPDCIRQSYQMILSCQSPEGNDLFRGYPLSEEVIRRFAMYERTALKMMDRLHGSQNMSLNDRKHFYYELLIYSHNILNVVNADLVIYTEIPHNVAQYVFYAVAKEKGVEQVMFGYLPFYQERFVMLRDIEDHPLNNGVIMDDGTFGPEVADMIRQYLMKITGDREKAVPRHMKEHNKTSRLTYIAKSFLKRTLNPKKLLTRGAGNTALQVIKTQEGLIRLQPLSLPKRFKIRFAGLQKKKKLKATYASLASDIDLDASFVYIPLHYQPERTTVPDGGIYADQWLLINLVSSALPSGWSIYVKEHPVQYHPRLDGELGRDTADYHRIRLIDKVKLVPITTDTLLLTDKSKAVISVNSSATFEAYFRRKPAIVFAKNNWLINWPGVFHCDSKASLVKVFEQIEKGIVYDDNGAFDLMKKLHKATREIRMLPKYNTQLSEEENVSRLHDIFVGLERQLQLEKTQV